MKSFFSRVATTAICLLVLGYINCGNPQKESSLEKVSFPIMTWVGPDMSLGMEKVFQGVVDAGFTVNFTGGTREVNLRALDIAQKVGLKLLIGDPRINPDKPIDFQALLAVDSVIADYKNHPALFGYYLRDEPGASLFDNLAKLHRYFKQMDPEHLAYINLFPNYANEKQLGVPTYEKHVAQYMDRVRPVVLSYDFYCITNKGLRDGYYDNMEVIRTYAMKYNVPFWAFTLSTSHYSYPMPTEGHIRFQLYSDLAYGAQGLQYFTYGHIKSEGFYTAPLDSLGNPTPIWYMARNVNREILQLSSVLKTLHSINVYHSKPLPKGTRSLPENFLIKTVGGAPLVIGYFQDIKGRSYLMLVHRNYENVGDVQLKVSDAVKGLIEVNRADATELTVLTPEKNIILLRFEAGDGRLFRVEQ